LIFFFERPFTTNFIQQSPNMSPRYTRLSAVQQDLAARRLTLPDLLEYYLQNAEKTQYLNIYIELFADEARERAAFLQQKYNDNPASVGALFGAVISIKDVICYAEHGVTAASQMLTGFESIYSATAVERILAQDAIIIGRTNCDQFAMGSDNTNSHYGATRNAANSERVAGGSSGGAAVSVQADTCLMALGSDTGGSVRQPAAFCGVVGLKPSYGRISRHGLLAYGSSFDQIGTLTQSVEDAALLLGVMAGADEFDATVSPMDVPDYVALLNEKTEKAYKIAYFADTIAASGMDKDIQNATQTSIAQLQKNGCEVTAVPFDLLDFLIPAYYVLTTAEASSNLSRYDGVRYGYRAADAQSLDETYRKSRTEGFSTEVKRRILLGTFVLSAGYYDAYYTKAQKVRQLLVQRINEIFAEYDFILLPASPVAPWRVGEKSDDAVAMYLADIYTVLANMVGIPAIALPIGTDTNGLPMGIQLMAKKMDETALLQLVHWCETEQILRPDAPK
jgi:aspartyl-tRNA(Asn)/glutamyl-tRNA(Gln) amidotransferase subunit A